MGEGKSLLNCYPDSEADTVKYLGIKETFAKSTVSMAENGWKTIMEACSTDKRLMYTEKNCYYETKSMPGQWTKFTSDRFTKKSPLNEWKDSHAHSVRASQFETTLRYHFSTSISSQLSNDQKSKNLPTHSALLWIPRLSYITNGDTEL